MYKKDFPIFKNKSNLVFLDNAASTQKPQYVIDWIKDFLSNDYANIHRWDYFLSEKSEELYHSSKQIVSEFLNCRSWEIIYSYNATYSINLISQSLVNSNFIKNWDSVLLWIREHHANILTWQILSKRFWFDIKYVNVDKNYEIDRKDFQKKYDNTVKVVSLWHVSNVTWKIYDLKKIKSFLRKDTFFMVDWSQSFPNMPIDVQEIWCDCFVFTAHKVMADTWLWVIYLKKDFIKTIEPMISGWWAITDVDEKWYSLPRDYSKFEAGTPNIIWAVSLLKSLEYIKNIWWIQKVREHEQKLVKYALEKFSKLKDKVVLIWPKNTDRVAVFSFFIPTNKNFNNVWEFFSQKNIAIRCGWHCAYLIHKKLKIPWTCRMSAYLYNDFSDIDIFFNRLENLIKS